MAADSRASGDASASSSYFGGVEIKTRLGTDASTGGGRSGHDKLLDLRAERHADAASADPTDFDAHYSWALVLQEQAERAEQTGIDPNRRDAILIDACAKYAKARDLRGDSISTLYNWGIALGDRARLKGDAGDKVEARAMWGQACEKYRAAVECDVARTQSTQALNNWGLALQQMSSLERDPEKRTARLLAAVGRFREAIRRDPGFHRAVYNLGTIMYALSERAGRGQGGGGGRRRGLHRQRRSRCDDEWNRLFVKVSAGLGGCADERGRAPDRRGHVHMLRASLRRQAGVRVVASAGTSHPPVARARGGFAVSRAAWFGRGDGGMLAPAVVRAGPRGVLDG